MREHVALRPLLEVRHLVTIDAGVEHLVTGQGVGAAGDVPVPEVARVTRVAEGGGDRVAGEQDLHPADPTRQPPAAAGQSTSTSRRALAAASVRPDAPSLERMLETRSEEHTSELPSLMRT